MPETSLDRLIEQTEHLMRQLIDEMERESIGPLSAGDLPVYDVIRYHLGWVDEQFAPVHSDPGKRVRPAVCLLAAGAAGGDPQKVVPVAAAIEFLHNFTLMHDDIQDRSELRRGRRTVWVNWGEAQAINAGDAAFAVSQIALLRLLQCGVDPTIVAEIVEAFNQMTLRIVEGQVLDLGFEDRWDIDSGAYFRMISGKTAAIVAFAAWAGARVSGVPPETADRFSEFGRRLGLGFQIRDDYLGIWGDIQETGKHRGDDIRGRKKSIPIVLLSETLEADSFQKLRGVYEAAQLSEDDVDTVTELLEEHQIDHKIEAMSNEFHDSALSLLREIAAESAYRDALQMLAERLVDRVR